MELVKFEDKCIISAIGEYQGENDEYAEVVVYAGYCRYQFTRSINNSQQVIRSDRVYLPHNIRCKVKQGQTIQVKTLGGDTIKGIISDVRIVKLPLTSYKYYQIFISQAQYE